MFEALLTPEGIISLFTLTALEIVLGIDNIIFISIVAGRLPKEKQRFGRMLGMMIALVVRIILLFGISWITSLDEAIIVFWDKGFTFRDLILIFGGLFLIFKSTSEIHEKMSGDHDAANDSAAKRGANMAKVIIQIVLIDIVFSFDSILTAIGLVQEVSIMVTAVVIAMCVMILFVNAVSDFVDKNPTVKMLALSFLIMIGTLLIGEGWGFHMEKGYVYFAMAFSFTVEILNLRLRTKKLTQE